MVDAAVLKAELDADPTALGYAPHMVSGNDPALVTLLNEIRIGISIPRDLVPTYEIFEAIVPSEWSAASAEEKQRVQLILSMGMVDVRGQNTKDAFMAAFAAGTTTRANLIALVTRTGSRAEQLFGQAVSINDIVEARLT